GSSFIQCIIPYEILNQEKTNELNGNTEQDIHSKVHSKVHSKITVAQQKVLDLITKSNNITTQELSVQLGISTRMVATHVKALKELGVIRRIGSDKTGYWEVLK
ncbi:MAG: winged helix-turn-helix transcriptional regulator, partial [Firmicutes bacterium]|nr:winged helix-turn-helix transcriptional regulator [Bacillota bacterium]